MNNVQLTSMASSCPEMMRHFMGVFAIDILPDMLPAKPCSYICNLDASVSPGSHWVAFYFPKRGMAEYFDSYGLPPSEECLAFLRSSSYCSNDRFIQSPLSAVCGQYCLYYLWQRDMVKDMESVLRVFSDFDQLYNDCFVNDLIEKHFSVDLRVFDVDWQLQQYSRSYA